jgi:hypothetical protein
MCRTRSVSVLAGPSANLVGERCRVVQGALSLSRPRAHPGDVERVDGCRTASVWRLYRAVNGTALGPASSAGSATPIVLAPSMRPGPMALPKVLSAPPAACRRLGLVLGTAP